MRSLLSICGPIEDIYTVLYDRFLRKNHTSIQKVISNIDIPIANGCNLGCYCCDHFSQFAPIDDIYDYDRLEKDLKRLKELNLRVSGFSICGGEPLLNKSISQYIKLIKDIYTSSDLTITTNGILLTSMDDEFWKVCHETDTHITITPYQIQLNRNDIYDKAKRFMVDVREPYYPEGYKTSWKMKLNRDGSMDPIESFKHCTLGNVCLELYNGKLYTCVLAANAHFLNEYTGSKLESSDEDCVDIYEDLITADKVLKKMASPIPFCRYCETEKWGPIGPWRLSDKTADEYFD